MGSDLVIVGGSIGNVRSLNATQIRLYQSGLSGVVPVITLDDGAGNPVNLSLGTGFVASTVPQCVVRHSVNQTILNATDTALAFDVEQADTDTMHDNTTNNSRITATTAGKYLVTVDISFASNATGFRAITLKRNGTTIIARVIGPPTNGERTEISLAFHVTMPATDYIEVYVYQTSGGALNCEAIGSVLPQFAALWVNP